MEEEQVDLVKCPMCELSVIGEVEIGYGQSVCCQG